jgi:hypothetical protein
MENHSLYEHFVWMCDDFCGEDDTLCATNATCDGEDQSLYDNAWRHRDLHIHHIIRGVVLSQYITKCIFYVTNYHVELFFLYQIVTDDV